MSDPLSDVCAYCGSPDVLDDAWWCDRLECWDAYKEECREAAEYEARTPLTRLKARGDLMELTVEGASVRDLNQRVVALEREPSREDFEQLVTDILVALDQWTTLRDGPDVDDAREAVMRELLAHEKVRRGQ